MAIDVERLLTEALTQHGIRLDPHDPAVVLVTLNRLVLKDATKSVVAEIRTATREFEEAASRVQSGLGAAIAARLKSGTGGAPACASWPRRAYLAMGLGSAGLFLMGIAVGKWVLR
jgi:hypothetical protein